MSGAPVAADQPQILSEADCRDLLNRLARLAVGGGYTDVGIFSTWVGNVRWARNKITTSGEVRDNSVQIRRNINGAAAGVFINDITDAALMAAARRAERLVTLYTEMPNSDLTARLPLEAATHPNLFSEATCQLDAEHRVAAAIELMQAASSAGLFSAGYIEVAAVSMARLDTFGRIRYFPYTQARYSVTVRDPKASGSGWAGVDGYDWGKIDAKGVTARALEKCLRSRHPVAIEPGRYTTILEPQAVSDFVGQLLRSDAMGHSMNDGGSGGMGPFLKSLPTQAEPGYTMLGEKIVDERVTISADPEDLELGFLPFNTEEGGGRADQFENPVYHPVTWIKNGVLTTLAYERFADYGGMEGRDKNLGMPNSGAFRMSGGTSSIDEMIATTKRGLLVTRFDQILMWDMKSQLYGGYTRDGLWLIENGKISKSVKNMVFTESILFALNNIEQLGPPQRVFHPNVAFGSQIPKPAIVPSLKIRDFSFTALVDAV